MLAPWTTRNLLVHGAFIPASTSNGPLLHGSAEEFWLIHDRERELPKYLNYLRNEKGIVRRDEKGEVVSRTPSWVEKDQYYRRAAVEKYRQRWEEDPLSFFPFLAKKFLRLWYATESGTNHALVLLINLPLYVFGLIGLWLLFRSGNRLGHLITLLLLYAVLLHVAVFAYFRYVVPIMPYVILLAAYGATYLVQQYRGGRAFQKGDLKEEGLNGGNKVTHNGMVTRY